MMMTARPRIVIDADIPFIRGVLEAYADTIYIKGDKITASDIKSANALIIRTRTTCNKKLLEGSSVKLIATATIGYDHINLPYCEQAGIKVVTSAGCNARGVLQYVMGALSCLSIKHKWQPTEKTLGVVGVGNVGSLVAQYGKLLGFKVLCSDPPKQAQDPSLGYISLTELLPQCDIITMHVPFIPNRTEMTEGIADTANNTGVDNGLDKFVKWCGLTDTRQFTEGMASEAFFDMMRQGAIFINSSRGGVIKDEALIKAIEDNKIIAVIDTWNGEPAINHKLLDIATLATPHIAGYSIQGKAAATAAVIAAVSQQFGLPLDDWYPPEVQQTAINNKITWRQIQEQMPHYFDIAKQSETVKNRSEMFEQLRNNYTFRTEFF